LSLVLGSSTQVQMLTANTGLSALSKRMTCLCLSLGCCRS
jgi:hypothetical protein